MSDHNPYAPPQSSVRDPEPRAETGELASRTLRFIGALIDSLASAVIVVPTLVFSGVWQRAIVAGQVSFGDTLLIALGSVGVFLLLNGYLLATAGQTIGKRLVGTRIVTVSDERIPSFLTLVGARYGSTWLVSLIPGLGNLYGLVDSLFVFRSDRRCVHDLIAGTKVINA